MTISRTQARLSIERASESEFENQYIKRLIEHNSPAGHPARQYEEKFCRELAEWRTGATREREQEERSEQGQEDSTFAAGKDKRHVGANDEKLVV